ncbi:MAG TPA: hypothetical protein VHD85_08165 [Terracidiphilus sp.]|nr:hypothetical protein [Terracidiphilus sp.]
MREVVCGTRIPGNGGRCFVDVCSALSVETDEQKGFKAVIDEASFFSVGAEFVECSLDIRQLFCGVVRQFGLLVSQDFQSSRLATHSGLRVGHIPSAYNRDF